MARRPAVGGPVDLSVQVGSVALRGPVMTASGTAGHGDELAGYFDLSSIGAVVVKSLGADPWAGNPSPRVHQTPAGMLNSVGLQGRGIEYWRTEELPALLASGATVVASIWGRAVEDYARAAELLADLPEQVVLEAAGRGRSGFILQHTLKYSLKRATCKVRHSTPEPALWLGRSSL